VSADPFLAARRRLAAQVAALMLAVLAVAAVGVLVGVGVAAGAAARSTRDLIVRSALEPVSLDGAVPEVDEGELREEFEELDASFGVVAIAIWDDAGNLVAETSIHHEALAREGPERERRADGVEVVREALPNEVLVFAQRTEEREELLRLLGGMGCAAAPVALVVLMAAWGVTGLALAPVRDSLDRQRAFFADASHELRTPLAVIRAHLDQVPAEVRGALAPADAAVARMARLVDDLRMLARPSGIPVAHRVAFSLDEVVADTVRGLAATAPDRELRVDAGTDEIRVHGDPDEVGRLVSALVENALRGFGGQGNTRCPVVSSGVRLRRPLRPQMFHVGGEQAADLGPGPLPGRGSSCPRTVRFGSASGPPVRVHTDPHVQAASDREGCGPGTRASASRRASVALWRLSISDTSRSECPSASRTCAARRSSSRRGRPTTAPRARAAATPATVRLTIRFRSNSAKAPTI
jgi:signal transduction histidine kinase